MTDPKPEPWAVECPDGNYDCKVCEIASLRGQLEHVEAELRAARADREHLEEGARGYGAYLRTMALKWRLQPGTAAWLAKQSAREEAGRYKEST